ncbi:MAG TPA: GNAT family N-acetyltransferase [Thermoplasmata archaeon]|nr:GNAT family N-acetyltransferase [Thermoplasmata archaeon]
MPNELRPARELARDELWNLVGTIRHQLGVRGEILPASWVDETADAILQGVGTAWFCGEERAPTAVAILWLREKKGYGHLHAVSGAEAVPDLIRLGAHLAENLSPEIDRLDMGSTGLPEPQELELGRGLSRDPRFSMLLRHSMVRTLSSSEPPPNPRWPDGLEVTTVRHVPFDELTSLDWRTYRGTPDETLLSGTPEGNRELLENALAGLFGQYLDDASPAARDRSGTLLGFAVACQESLRSGILLDLAVDPEFRRHGLGEALVLRTLRALLALGYPKVHLWVTDGNRPARALYDKVGFTVDASAAIYRWFRTPRGTGTV